MNREPSAHSMTVETSDRENLAEKVFLLEKWQAKAVQMISQIESERDEARASLEAAEASIDSLRASLHCREAELIDVRDRLRNQDRARCTAEEQRDELKAHNAALVKANEEYRSRGQRLQTMCRALVDAV